MDGRRNQQDVTALALRLRPGGVRDLFVHTGPLNHDGSLDPGLLFSGYQEQQTRLALAAVPPSVDLLIGLPAYHSDTIGHHAAAETVAAAIRGVRLADDGRRNLGVALYVDFAATAADWASYDRDRVR